MGQTEVVGLPGKNGGLKREEAGLDDFIQRQLLKRVLRVSIA
jgi:hypothetical protein